MLIDTHTHLENHSDYAKCINGTGPKDWDAVLSRAKKDKKVIPFLGLHPWYVASSPKNWQETLEKKLMENKAGIGEIGLDKNHEAYKAQMKAFEAQCGLAIKLDRPVSVHNVKSTKNILDTIKKFKGLRFAIHAFKGSVETIREIEKVGGFIALSFNTDPETIKAVSPEHLLIESDTYKGDLKFMLRMVNTVRESEYQGLIENNARRFLKGLI